MLRTLTILATVLMIIAHASATDASDRQTTYLELVTPKGCKVVRREAWGDEQMAASWDGSCIAGLTDGSGVLKVWSEETLTWLDNIVTYDGSMSQGRRHGQGNAIGADVQSKGTWVSGELVSGMYRWNSGHVFEGNFKNGQMHGEGQMTYPNGNRFVGQYRDGIQTGPGKIFYKNGSFFRGHFIKGKFDGKGLYRDVSGWSYRGNFQDGKFFGKGTLFSRKGTKYDAIWEDDLMTHFPIHFTVDRNFLGGMSFESTSFCTYEFERYLIELSEYLTGHGAKKRHIVDKGTISFCDDTISYTRSYPNTRLAHCGWLSNRVNENIVPVKDENGKAYQNVFQTDRSGGCESTGYTTGCAVYNCFARWNPAKHRQFLVQSKSTAERIWEKMPPQPYRVHSRYE